MAVFCVEGRLQCEVEGREYRIGGGDFFVYMPGQVIGEILLSQHADVKVIAFAQRVCQYAEHHPEVSLQVSERRVWPFAP